MRNPASGVTPHSAAWYQRLARRHDGYAYPWTSQVDPGGGEAAYTARVLELLGPDLDVLEPGCGHGADALAFAPHCRCLRAYDQVDRWVARGRAAARAAGLDNLTFLCQDSRADRHGGRVRVPALTGSIDRVISRRGPTHWIADAPRFCRPGAILLQLQVLAPRAEYRWNPQLPEGLRLLPPPADPEGGLLTAITARLDGAGLRLRGAWTFDVAERLPAPGDLYRFLTFGCDPDEVPPWPAAAPHLERLFAAHAGSGGLELRNRRLLWEARLDAAPSGR